MKPSRNSTAAPKEGEQEEKQFSYILDRIINNISLYRIYKMIFLDSFLTVLSSHTQLKKNWLLQPHIVFLALLTIEIKLARIFLYFLKITINPNLLNINLYLSIENFPHPPTGEYEKEKSFIDMTPKRTHLTENRLF